MVARRSLTLLTCACMAIGIGCAVPIPEHVPSLGMQEMAGGLRFEAVVDPATGSVTITPADFRTQAAGVWVQSANAVWSAPVFSFDLIVTNNSGSALNTVRGIVLSTTPPAPTVTATGTNGTLPTGQPYYDYGTVANGASGTVNWKFSIPSATPFRFGFTIHQGSGTDAGPQKNWPPVVSKLVANPASVPVNTATTITATASDPTADSLTYNWSAPSGGAISGSGASVTYTAPGAAGTYPVTVTVDDGKGGTATQTVNVSVTAGGGTDGTAQGNVSFGNVPSPTVKRVTLSPASVTIDPGDPLTITATGYDNPGNPVATKWHWSQTGTTAMIWRGTFDHATSGNTANWRTFFGRTDAGPVTVTARSENNQTASMTINVRELAPTVASTNPAATVSVVRNTARSFTVVFQDGNGNNTVNPVVTLTPNTNHLGYGWSWNSPDLDGKRTVTVNVNGFTLAGDTKTLSVTQADAAGNSVTHSWNITVTN